MSTTIRMGHTVARAVTLVVATLLLPAGGLVAAWGFGWSSRLTGDLSTAGVTDVTGAGWWPWVSGGVALLLALLVLALATRRLPLGSTALRLAASDGSGRLEVDLGSLADAAAADLAHRSALDRPCSRTAVRRARGVVELRARAHGLVELDALSEAADAAVTTLRSSLPAEELDVRVVLDPAPRRRRSPRGVEVRATAPASGTS